MDVRNSFCFFACEQEDPVLMIEDATVIDKYKNMDAVINEPNFNFYAGAPLVTPSGCKLGTLCVMDNKSNYLDEHQLKALSQLAQQVVAQLELRLSVLLLKKKTEVLERINDDKNRFIGKHL
jgi:GAF domain-containing protein